MKIEDLQEDVAAGVAKMELREFEDFEEALEELKILFKLFEEKDFGVLIGRKKKFYSETDVRAMRRKLHDILYNNDILSGDSGGVGDIDKFEDLRLIGHKLSSAIEIAGSSIFTGLLGALVVGTASNPLTAVLTPVAAGVAAVGGVASAANIVQHKRDLQIYNAAGRVLAIVDGISKLQNPQKVKRSLWQRFTDKLLARKPSEVEKDGKKFIKQKTRELNRKMEKLYKGLPKHIMVKDRDGTVTEFPSARLFMT